MNHTLVLTVRRVKKIWHAGLKRLRFFGRWNMAKFYKNRLDLDVVVNHAMHHQIVDVVKIVHNPFASGILATGPVKGANYKYAPATPEILEKTGAIESICKSHGVTLRAAALQFVLQHPIVAAIIPGAIQKDHVTSNIADYRCNIPPDLWTELKSEHLIRADAPTP